MKKQSFMLACSIAVTMPLFLTGCDTMNWLPGSHSDTAGVESQRKAHTKVDTVNSRTSTVYKRVDNNTAAVASTTQSSTDTVTTTDAATPNTATTTTTTTTVKQSKPVVPGTAPMMDQ